MTVHSYPHDELFQQAGPEDSLDYLWGRLQDRDLSGEEALALLSVVHRQLGAGRAGDPKVYFAYTRFMESLSREMPLVHDYVVSRWIENRRSSRRAKKRAAQPASGNADEDGQASPQLEATRPNAAAAASSFPHMIPVGGGSDDEPEEPGEVDEGTADRPGRVPRSQAEPGDDDEQRSDSQEGDGEDPPQSEPPSSREEQDDELTYPEEASQEQTADADGDTGGVEETAEASAETESSEDGDTPGGDGDESQGRVSGGESSDSKGETDEGEWPAEEQPEPPEPMEEMKGEGDEPSPPD